jgi:uncharacterized SAM-binding protein YcdF (DUF218 family)
MGALSFIASLAVAVAVADRGQRLALRRRQLAWALSAVLLAAALLSAGGALVVQKWLGRLIMPVGLIWLALFAASLWLLWRRERRLGMGALALFVGFTLAGNEVLAAKLMSFLENDHPAVPARPKEPYDAIAVLGGGTGETPDDTVQLNASGDRVLLAARLYHRGFAPLLVTTGIGTAGMSSPVARDLSAETAAIWTDLGIDEQAIVAVAEGRNTSEEIAVLARLARERSWTRVGLVTSAWHMPRAMDLAVEAGLGAVPLPADYRGGRMMLTLVQVVPSGGGFELIHRAVWERVGRLVGR